MARKQSPFTKEEKAILDAMTKRAREEKSSLNLSGADFLRLLGCDPESDTYLNDWVQGSKEADISTTRLVKIYRALGLDLIEMLHQVGPPSKELAHYFARPRNAEDIASGVIPPNEIYALRAVDRLGIFKGKDDLWIERYHVDLRRLAGKRANE